jgi:hypothetical protein
VRRLCLLFRVSGFVLLNILLFSAAPASGQLAVNPSSMTSSNVQVGSSANQSLVLGNSGQSNVTVSQATIVGSGFSLSGPALPLTLAAGQNAIFSVSFTPKSSGAVSGILSLLSLIPIIHDRSGKHDSTSSTTTTVSLTGTPLSTASTTPGQLVANPGSLGFATIQVGSSQTQSATLTNSGGSSVTIAQAIVTGAGFSLSDLTLPLTLTAGQSVTFRVAFAPLSAGSASGGISVSSDALTPALAISLAGTGATQGQLAVTPASADFGTVTVGTSESQRGTLTASGIARRFRACDTDSQPGLGLLLAESFPCSLNA